jgi:hypothetical protein
MAVLIHVVGEDEAAATVLLGVTVTVVVPEGLGQPFTVATTV